MNVTAITLALSKIKAVADGLFAVSSLIVVPVLVTVPLVWVLEKPHNIIRTKRDSPQQTTAYRSQGKTEIALGIEVDRKPLRTTYYLELVDPHGTVVYRYPMVETRDTPQFDNMLISVPESIEAGTYTLVAQVNCVINPITTTTASIMVASLVVD